MPAVFTRIRVRILAITLMAIVPAVLLICSSAAEQKSRISRDIEDNALRLSRFLANNLERDLSEGKAFLTATAELLDARPADAAPSGVLLSGLLEPPSVYDNLAVAGADGQIRSSARPFPPGARFDKLDWFAAMASGKDYTVGFDFSGVLGRQASIVLALPIAGPKAPPGRVLFAIMNLDWLTLLAQGSRLPPGSAISVTNKKGDAVARYPDPDKWVGKSYPPSRFMKNENVGEGVALAIGIDGIERVYAYSPVHGAGDMVVHVGIRREAIWEPANRAFKRQLTALGIVAILAILAAWFGSDLFLLKQVRALIQATKNLTAGRLGSRSSLSYDKGELGELARAFDEMAETLEWRDAQLRESEFERADPVGILFRIVESFPYPCLLVDPAFEIKTSNARARALFPAEHEILPGRSLSAFFPAPFSEALRSRLQRQFDSGSSPPARGIAAQLAGSGGAPIKLDIGLSGPVPPDKSFVIVILRVVGEEPVPAP